MNGYIDKSGTMVITPKYTFAWSFVQGLALIRNNGVESYVDRTGKKIWGKASTLPKSEVETEGSAPLPPTSALSQPKSPSVSSCSTATP